jgi:poly(A) polymerase
MTSPTNAIQPRILRPEEAGWLADDRLTRLMRAIGRDGEEIRVVGGAVRNALLRRPVADVDLATTALPETVMERARHAGMKPVPTGIDHGTVTVVVDGHPFEVTTLRRDVETHGRRATVAFGRDWSEDAHRRDFTINALYATATGEIIDLVGGVADCLARRVRFIGLPDDRIREDYLRILRFFRFHAAYGAGDPDPEGLAACIRLKHGIASLSSERIGQEILKLVVTNGAPSVLNTMAAGGILPLVLGAPVDLSHFDRLHALLKEMKADAAPMMPEEPAPLLLVALRPGAGQELAQHLRLSNAMRDRMLRAHDLSLTIGPECDRRQGRALIFRAGNALFRDALLLAATAADRSPPALGPLLELAQSFPQPRLPVNGRDLITLGYERGKDLGEAIAALERTWVDSDFTLDRAALLASLPPRPPGSCEG